MRISSPADPTRATSHNPQSDGPAPRTQALASLVAAAKRKTAQWRGHSMQDGPAAPSPRGTATTSPAAPADVAPPRPSSPGSEDNFIATTDSYKETQHEQYPPGITHIHSYLESRTGAKFDETVFFGLQYVLKNHFVGGRITAAKIDAFEATYRAHFGTSEGFNRAGWEHIVQHHGGRLPLSIRAIPEGTPVPTSHVLATVENTDDACAWLPGLSEGLLQQVWYPATVATQSRHMKKIISRYLTRTADDTSGLLFKLHDFGFRGVSCVEQAKIGGAAHLVNFLGTDTLPGITMARDFYHEPMAGFSVPAAEHSTITSWGRAKEVDAYRHMLTLFPKGPVSMPVDSYDFDAACSDLFGDQLKDLVLARDGVTIIRPDSGVPKDIVLRAHELLGAKFPVSINSKGYKVLHPKLAVIQGDGIDVDSIEGILDNLVQHGWSTQSLVLGSGGGLLQKVNRDTQRFAFKASWARINGQEVHIYKDPITDPSKRSKSGRLKLVMGAGGYETVDISDPRDNLLQEVFRDGELLVDQTFADIRKRAELPASQP